MIPFPSSRRAFALGLAALALAGSARAQPLAVQAGIDFASGAVVVSVRPTQAFNNATFSNVVFTLRYPSGNAPGLGAVTGPYGVIQDKSGSGGGFDYRVYAAAPTAFVTWEPGITYEIARIAASGSVGSVELAPYAYANPFNGAYYVELNTVGYDGGNGGEEFYDATTELPVELVSFTAASDGPNALLRWSTASETNNAGFGVEHADGEGAFAEVTFVEGAGTTAEGRAYERRVEGLAPGAHRFRLRQVDADGTARYSPTVEVAIEAPRVLALLQSYPNPATTGAEIGFTVPAAGDASLVVYDALGREVAHLFDGPAEAGQVYKARFEAGTLGAGVYAYRLVHGGRTLTKTLTLVR